jgi:hypothetical protein
MRIPAGEATRPENSLATHLTRASRDASAAEPVCASEIGFSYSLVMRPAIKASLAIPPGNDTILDCNAGLEAIDADLIILPDVLCLCL